MSSYILVKRFGILAGLLLLSCCRNAGTRAEAVRPSLSPNIVCLDSACRTYRTIPFVRRKVKWGFACLGNVPPGTTINPRLPPIEYVAEDVGKPGFPKLTRHELVALRELRRVDDSPQLRIAWVDGPDVRETGTGSIRNLFALEKRRRLAFPTTSVFGAFSPFADREPLRDVPLMVCSWQPRIKRRFQRVLVPDHPDTWGTT